MSERIWPIRAAVGMGLTLGVLSSCAPPAPPPSDGGLPPPTSEPHHQQVFTEILPAGYQGPESCQICHSDVARALLSTGHWQWEGTSVNIVGHEQETHGKRDLVNSFFIGVPSNEGRCSQCHISYNYRDNTFDFSSTANIDCFICHDSTGTYAKAPTADNGGGQSALLINGQLTVVGPPQLQQVAYVVNLPTRRNCGACHFFADGGDNVKHGDMSSDLAQPTEAMDFHMGALDFTCQTCHSMLNHGIAGFTLHSVDEGGASPDCTRCHDPNNPHAASASVADVLNLHLEHVACQSCHIPAFARSKPTQVGWFWDTAGQDISPIPVDQFGQPTYDKMKGTLVWGQNIRPTYHWSDGKWRRLLVGSADTYIDAGTPDDPIVLAEPVATKDTPGAKVFPFKVMRGRQPADTVNRRLIVPHLFGTAAGPNAYWDKFDWAAALREGATYSGVPFSGTFGFPNTVMFLSVNHEVAPMEQALHCNDCHFVPEFWSSLGLVDPLVLPQ